MFILQFKGKVQLYLKAIMDLYSLGWLSEKKGKLQDDWGLEQRCNFTNYPTHWSGALSPAAAHWSSSQQQDPESQREKETGWGWNIMGVIKFRLSLFGTNRESYYTNLISQVSI